ncbi:hypothetical protein CK203_060256 [Vitis vinifera]|uniref:Uncharacterized protein n=1 Tax=Vitis vinifera TaxID=29760 RepID=A0A438GLN2_VITVI|nr:hypothetical protein CK203_060256 [Vitis vinifera]
MIRQNDPNLIDEEEVNPFLKVATTPGSRSLYRAMRTNSAMNFGKSLMGNLAAIDLFSDHVLVGDLITYQIRHRLHP